MAANLQCDVAIIGGGLAGGLAALALAAKRPGLAVLLVEAGPAIGGNHIWSFFGSDVARAQRGLLDPLVTYGWKGYDVAFPGHARGFDQPYYSITSERLDAVVRATLPPERLLTGRRVLTIGPRGAGLDDGTRIEAKGVIDARGAGTLRLLDTGWQKFVGQELKLAAPHGLTRPIVMDATVEQIDGYRFVYVLPFAEDRVFIEDTYYSDSPALQDTVLTPRIARYAAQRGWEVEAIERTESGVLPVTMGGDFDAYWRSTGVGIAKIGVRAGLFHPTTGYSLPDAVRTAHLLAELPEFNGEALHDAFYAHAKTAWEDRSFYRLLDRMLFRAAAPPERYRVLERFYTLDAGLIRRFYAGQSTGADKMRVLAGKPPVPFFRALGVLRESTR